MLAKPHRKIQCFRVSAAKKDLPRNRPERQYSSQYTLYIVCDGIT